MIHHLHHDIDLLPIPPSCHLPSCPTLRSQPWDYDLAKPALLYLTPLVPCSSYYFAALCSSCLVILINTVPGNSSSDSSPQGAPHSCLSTHHTYTSLRHQADTHNRSPSPRFPYTAPFPVRSFSPPKPFLCMQHPTRMPHVCLGACIVTICEALVFEKVPS